MNGPDRQLDDLLAAARWAAMPSDASARLRATLLSTRSQRHVSWQICAMAASVLIVVGAALLLTKRTAQRLPELVVRIDPKPPTSVTDIPVRVLNSYERVVLASMAKPRSAAVTSAPVPRPSAQSIDLLLKQILNPTTRDTALLALRNNPAPPVDALIARLDSPLVEQRFAAAKALGSLCHGPTLDVLKRMVASDVHRREALAALISCSNPAADEYLANLRRQPSLRAQVLAVQDQMKSLF